MFTAEKGLAIKDTEGLKVAYAKYSPSSSVLLPIEELEVCAKVQEEGFLAKVKESIENQGLWYPLVVRKLSHQEWKDEMDRVPTTLPFQKEQLVHLRVQCGCNRLVALKELGYQVVQCVVHEEQETVEQICKATRRDKRWWPK